MKPLTQEWVDKAEGDFATASREIRARKAPNYDAVCFHAQQCAEKYLKAILQEEGIAFKKTHNLSALLDLLISIEPSWDAFRPGLNSLTDAAVEVRYPGFSVDKKIAREMFKTCKEVRHLVSLSLGLTLVDK
jgi:HEPN domain-containing protein